MNLITERLLIRDFMPEDAMDLHAILGDEETMKNCEPAYDFAKTERFLSEFCIGRKGAVAAVHRESGRLIGYILFSQLEKDLYEIGWFFNRGYWQQGYAHEACRAVIDHAFNQMGAHKVFAETIDGVKSVRLMQKLGMKPEGVQRKQAKDNGGCWTDLYLFGLLSEDRKQEGSCKQP